MQYVSRLLEGQLLTLCDWNLYLHNDRPSPPSSLASYKPFLSLLLWPLPAFIISNWCFNSFCVKSTHHLLPHLSILAGRVFHIVLVCAYVFVHICTWMCVHVCVYACVCIQVHMGRAEHSLGLCSSGTIFVWFWNRISHWPRTKLRRWRFQSNGMLASLFVTKSSSTTAHKCHWKLKSLRKIINVIV